MPRIENHKYSIGEAFHECFYIVPDYQREYVWTDKEVHQLLDDINEQIDAGSDREYFIGTILVAPTSQRNHYEVIDGQQRLTTFFLLLCALRHMFQGEPQHQAISSLISTSYTDSSGEIRTSIKLEPRYENAGEVMAKIAEMDADPQTVQAGIRAAGITSFGSLEKLLGAYTSIHRYLSDNYDDIPQLKRYWGHLATNVIFIQISADVSSALKIFETINERGVGLNPMDLLKNLLFIHVRQEEFTRLRDEWKRITNPLEKAGEKPLRFLRYFLMASYPIRNRRSDGVVREDEIYEWFADKHNAQICNYAANPFEFVRKVTRSVERYIAFTSGHGNDGKPNLLIDRLKRLAGGAFSLHYILLLAAADLPEPLFDHFVAQLESFLFYYIFTKTATKDLERNFSLWADQLREIVSISDPDAQRNALNNFIAGNFEKNMAAKTAELSDALKRYSLNTMQKYRTRYLLARLAQHVDMAFQGLKKPGSLEPYTALEIEHILPDTPTDEMRDRWITDNLGADYDEYKNKLGNLTLLEKPINIVASNSFYDIKKDEYGKSRNYLTRSLTGLDTVGQNTTITRINDKLAAFDVWNAASIDQRHHLLAELIRDIWRIELLPTSTPY
jgi:hypothetical protein